MDPNEAREWMLLESRRLLLSGNKADAKWWLLESIRCGLAHIDSVSQLVAEMKSGMTTPGFFEQRQREKGIYSQEDAK